MAASRIRPSKYRHVFGTEFQAAEQYRDIRHGTFGLDGSPLKGTADNFAVAYAGVAGAVCVVSLAQKGALDHEHPPLLVHPGKEEVLDCNFARVQPNLLATSYGSGDVLLWDIPADGVKGVGTAPTAHLEAHPGKRVTVVEWHPLASNILATVDSTKVTKIFDVGTHSQISELPNPYKGLVSSVTWSGAGDLLATYAKDKKLRLFDPRANALVAEVEDHSGVKGGSVVWCNGIDRILTTGHDRIQNRCISLWDPRNMAAKVAGTSLDCSSSSLIPLLDQDTSVLFLGSRGDATIRILEVTNDGIHPLNEFKSVDSTAGLAALPKTACNVEKNEIFRVLKLVPSKNIVVPIRFEIPRIDTGIFQEDLFPPTWDGRPSMTAAEWASGANVPANRIDLRPH